MPFDKLAKLGLVAFKSNFAELQKPYKLNFAITYWCNSRCLTCNIWQLKPKNELTLQEIQEFTKKNNYFKWVELTGGEPFMRSDIVEVARAFAENMKDLYVLTLPTNSLVNKETVVQKLKEILSMRIPRVIVTLSLDGYAELHDKIRGVPGNYTKVMALANELHALQQNYKNLSLVFGYTISKYNVGMLEKTINAVKQELPWCDYNQFHINIGQVSDAYYKNSGNDFVVPAQSALADVKYLLSKRNPSLDPAQILEQAFLRKMVEFVSTGRQPVRSKSIDASLFLDSYGNVFPSIMWNEVLGNIRNTSYSLEPILHSSKAREIKAAIKEGKEPNAWTACEAYQALAGNLKELIL